MVETSLNPENPTPIWRIWGVFFTYSMVVAFIVQLILLPYVFPALHAGDGLMAGGDSVLFHTTAVDLSQKIKSDGWEVWELRPNGWAPAGIASAIYALTIPRPWTIIPIYTALHAIASLTLLRIIQIFIPDWRRAIWAVLPFLLYPSAMNWYTQMLKDGYSIAGTFLFIYGWILLSRLETWQGKWWIPLQGLALIGIGSGLIWVVRPYIVQMMQGLAVATSILLTAVFLIRGVQARLPWLKAVVGSLLVWAMVIILTPLTKDGLHYAEAPTSWKIASAVKATAAKQPADKKESPPQKQDNIMKPSPAKKAAQPQELSKDSKPSGAEKAVQTPVPVNTVNPEINRKAEEPQSPKESFQVFTKVLTLLDNKSYALSVVRQGFLGGYPQAKSNIDLDVSFKSVKDLVFYVPRAVQIAFFAPFPDQWFEQGRLGSSTLMRKISALEMTGVYIALALLPFAMWYWRHRIEIWVVLLFSTGMMLIYALVVPNIGALYRVRYGFIMTLVALGISGGFAAWQNRPFLGKSQGFGQYDIGA